MADNAISITLLCSKCTRERTITGVSREDCDNYALGIGWVMEGEKMTCPKCPAVRHLVAAQRP